MTSEQPRPWYVSERACDDYIATLGEGGDLTMLKALKILRSILVNIGLMAFSFYAIRAGGDPTIIASLALAVFGAYNGLELTDYLALLRAYNEVQADDKDS
jgi:pilus assembly protein TadC